MARELQPVTGAFLTDEQRAAVEADGREVYVSAGPGSGKTLVLAARIAWLLDRGVPADQICALTFTRAACAEIRRRVETLAGPAAQEVGVYTFHAAALVHGPSLGGRTLATGHEVEAAMRSLYYGPMRRPSRDLVPIEQLRDAIVRWEASGKGFGTCNEVAAVGLVRRRLHDAGLEPTWDLAQRYLAAPGERHYEHVLVDEAQDCTRAEVCIALDLAFYGDPFAVGDPRQAIMGWRGAVPGQWWDVMPPTHRLTRTFRFGPSIAAAANALEVGPPIDPAGVRSGVVGVPLTAPASAPTISQEPSRLAFGSLLDYIEEVGRIYDTSAILCRTHTDAAGVEAVLQGWAVHVRRDPLDALSSPADAIARVTAAGLIPILTVHAAKGLEWDQVIVIGPSSIEWGVASDDPEEMRVLYVAMTRARRRLVLVTGESNTPLWRSRACGVPSTAEPIEAA